jgi:hypothetical protein
MDHQQYVAMGTTDPSMLNPSMPQGPVFSPTLFYLHEMCLLKTCVDDTACIGLISSGDETYMKHYMYVYRDGTSFIKRRTYMRN